MHIEEVKLLDYLEHYMGEISDMFHVYAVHISKTYIPPVKKPCALQNPEGFLEMQLQIHMYLRDIIVFCNHALPYVKNLVDDMAIKNYWTMMFSVCKFIEQIVLDNEVLHVKPDPPALPDKTPLKLYLLWTDSLDVICIHFKQLAPILTYE